MKIPVPYGLNGDISDEAPTIGSGPAQRELPGPWPTPTAIGADMADGTDPKVVPTWLGQLTGMVLVGCICVVAIAATVAAVRALLF